jgi:hypothetical protein
MFVYILKARARFFIGKEEKPYFFESLSLSENGPIFTHTLRVGRSRARERTRTTTYDTYSSSTLKLQQQLNRFHLARGEESEKSNVQVRHGKS